MLQNDGLIDNVRVQPHNGGQFVPYGVGLWLSALNAIYRDVRYVVPFRAILDVRLACRISNLACPVKWRPLYGLNPMAGVIESFRWSLMGTGDPPSRMLVVSAAAVVAILVGGIMYFQSMETKIADVV